MPQELLRDVLRSGDASHRQRHWSVLPLTIAAHVALVGIVVIAPLAAVVPPPDLPSLTPDYVATIKPPEPPAVSKPRIASDAVPDVSETATTPTDVAPSEAGGARGLGVGLPGIEGAPGSLVGIGGAESGPGTLTVPPAAPPKIFRIGGTIREPKKVAHVAPEYPDLARRAAVEGVVVLEAVVDVSGRVTQVRVLRSVALLDAAAIQAVQQWRYTPTQLNGVPVPVLMTVTVRFALR
jgi:protein TonB